MYDSLAYLPEVFVNQSLPSYVDQHIFKPLDMSTATYSVAEAEAGQMAHGFQVSGQDLKRGLDGIKKAIVPYYVRPSEEALSVGSGGIIASARDMVCVFYFANCNCSLLLTFQGYMGVYALSSRKAPSS